MYLIDPVHIPLRLLRRALPALPPSTCKPFPHLPACPQLHSDDEALTSQVCSRAVQRASDKFIAKCSYYCSAVWRAPPLSHLWLGHTSSHTFEFHSITKTGRLTLHYNSFAHDTLLKRPVQPIPSALLLDGTICKLTGYNMGHIPRTLIATSTTPTTCTAFRKRVVPCGSACALC